MKSDKIAKAVIVFSLILAGLLILFVLELSDSSKTASAYNGPTGDFFNGIASPILFFAASILAYLNLKEQVAANVKQKEIFEETRKDGDTSAEIESVRYYISTNREVFKNMFVNDRREGVWVPVSGPEAIKSLLENEMDHQILIHSKKYHSKYLKNILNDFSPSAIMQITDHYKMEFGTEIFQLPSQTSIERIETLSSTKQFYMYFDTAYINRQSPERRQLLVLARDEYLQSLISKMSVNENKEIIKIAYDAFYKAKGYLCGHYFRNIFYVLEFIDKKTKYSDKTYLTKVFRSNLSSFEVIALFYNLCSDYAEPEYRSVVIKYDILNDLEKQEFLFSKYVSKHDKYEVIKSG